MIVGHETNNRWKQEFTAGLLNMWTCASYTETKTLHQGTRIHLPAGTSSTKILFSPFAVCVKSSECLICMMELIISQLQIFNLDVFFIHVRLICGWNMITTVSNNGNNELNLYIYLSKQPGQNFYWKSV